MTVFLCTSHIICWCGNFRLISLPTCCTYRNKMQKISDKFEEYHTRWKNIEELCGFPIVMVSRQSNLSLHRSSQDSGYAKSNGVLRTLHSSRMSLYSSVSSDGGALLPIRTYSEPSTYACASSMASDSESSPNVSSSLPTRSSAPSRLQSGGDESFTSSDSSAMDNGSSKASISDLASCSPQRVADESRRWRIGSRGSGNSESGLEVIKEVCEPYSLSKNLVHKLNLRQNEHESADDSDNSMSSESKKRTSSLKRIRHPLKARQSTL